MSARLRLYHIRCGSIRRAPVISAEGREFDSSRGRKFFSKFMQMALSWIFSGKKKEEKPIPVTVEAVEVGTDDDYTLIQANPLQPSGLYPQVPHSPYPPAPYIPLPYSVLPHREHQQSNSNTRSCVQSQLDGVPFVLNPALEQSSKKNYLIGIEDLRRAVFQIAADISDPMYDYDFKTEHNIMREASVYNHDN